MTPRERVYRTLNFDHPDRAPRDLWMLPIARHEQGDAAIDAFCNRWPTDFVQCVAGKPRVLRSRGNPTEIGTCVDEWGCEFENIQAGHMGEVKAPLISDYALMDERLRPPVELLAVDVDAVNAFCRASDRFVFASGWGRLWERTQFLRGTENVMMDLAEDAPELHDLLGRVHTFYRDQLEVWAKTEVDALVLMDDWGSQRSLLISPAQWRRVFKPLYAEYGQIARAHGKKLFMHSDGYISDIYGDLIEIGVHAVNSQLFCMDIEEIGRRWRGKLTFWGEIDRQHILPFGRPEDAAAAVRRVWENLRPAATGGGVIAQFELCARCQMANANAVFEEWERLPAPTRQGGLQ